MQAPGIKMKLNTVHLELIENIEVRKRTNYQWFNGTRFIIVNIMYALLYVFENIYVYIKYLDNRRFYYNEILSDRIIQGITYSQGWV